MHGQQSIRNRPTQVALLFVTPQTRVFLAAKDWFLETNARLLWCMSLSSVTYTMCWSEPLMQFNGVRP